MHFSATTRTFAMESPNRKLHFYENHFVDFFERQPKIVRDKIDWTFKVIAALDRIPETYLKHLENTNGLYEIRVQLGGNVFRIICFFDDGKLIVILNGFQKKSRKTPRNEIEKAKKIKERYYEDKKK